MKKTFITLFLALFFGYLGGYLGSANGPAIPGGKNTHDFLDTHSGNSQNISDENLTDSFQFELLKYKVEQLELQIETLSQQLGSDDSDQQTSEATPTRSSSSVRLPVKPNQQNLLAAGISTYRADEILRRISQQEYRRLELQNKISRTRGAEANVYRQELRELNQNKISLRTELGDDAYDQYLYASEQNNRVKVSSVMSGSPAESSGFRSNDIILSYDGKKILDWSDIRRATLEGEIDGYTNINVLRDAERITLTVPRGTLGVQLEPVQLNPAE